MRWEGRGGGLGSLSKEQITSPDAVLAEASADEAHFVSLHSRPYPELTYRLRFSQILDTSIVTLGPTTREGMYTPIPYFPGVLTYHILIESIGEGIQESSTDTFKEPSSARPPQIPTRELQSLHQQSLPRQR